MSEEALAAKSAALAEQKAALQAAAAQQQEWALEAGPPHSPHVIATSSHTPATFDYLE